VLTTKPIRERIKAQAKPPQLVKGLATPPSMIEFIFRIWLFTVDLPKDDRPRSFAL
jgi:hypothetical protein